MSDLSSISWWSGFIRLWVVTCVLWALFIWVATKEHFDLAAFLDNTSGGITSEGAQTYSAREVLQGAERAKAAGDEDAARRLLALIGPQVDEAKARQRQALSKDGLTVIAYPLISLAVLFALRWIMRGFRTRPSG